MPRRIVLESGLRVRRTGRASRCDAVVIAQQPLRGSLIPEKRGGAHTTTVILRLRG